MIPTLREMCMVKLESLMRTTMTGRHYSDYHVSYRDECELDIMWFHGEWTIVMRHNGILHMAKIGAGEITRLVRRWKKIFLFANNEPYPGLYDIAIHDFEINLEQRSVVFFGNYFNENSRALTEFQTKFTFSATSHLLKIETGVMINGMLTVVGLRFLRQPDTENYDLFR
jgi:hypothetical protein